MKAFLISLFLFVNIARADFFDTKNLEVKVLSNQNSARNFITNPSCKRNVVSITGSSVAAVRNVTTALDGVSDCKWDPTATSQTLTYAVDSLVGKLKGGNCQAKINYLGDASLVKANVQVNSINQVTDVQLTNTGTNSGEANLYYPCGDGSTATTLVLTSTGNAANVQYEVYLGKNTDLSQVAQASVVGTMTKGGNDSGCTFAESSSSGSTAFQDLTVGSGCNGWTVTGAVTSQGVEDHRLVYANMPSGNYTFELTGAFETTVSGLCNFRLHDGTNPVTEDQTVFANANEAAPNLIFNVNYTTSGSRTFKIQAADNHGGACQWNTGSNYPGATWTVKRFPLASELAINANSSPAYWSGYHDNTCDWSITQTTFAANYSNDASCAFTTSQSSNISASIVGSARPAITLTLPKTGAYYVCAKASFYGSVATAHAHRLWDGTNVIATGSENSNVEPTTISLCGVLNATTLSPTIEIQSNAASGTNVLQAQRAGANAIEWSVFAISQNTPAPILVGSVTSNSTGANSTIDANLNCDAASAITSQNAGVSAIGNRSGAGCALTLTTGICASTPYKCSVTINSATVQSTGCTCASATSCTMYGPSADYDAFVSIMCAK